MTGPTAPEPPTPEPAGPNTTGSSDPEPAEPNETQNRAPIPATSMKEVPMVSSSRKRGVLALAGAAGGVGKTALFALGLVIMFGAAYLIGWVASPDAAKESTTHSNSAHSGNAHRTGTDDAQPGGLLVSDQGYTLRLLSVGSDNADTLAFRIIGPGGATVTTFDTKHDRRLHLIVVRRDLSGFRHLHPEMSSDGTWRTASPFGQVDQNGGIDQISRSGSYRVLADFAVTNGPALTLGSDVHLTGDFAPVPLPQPSNTATVHGYTVTMTGTLKPGKASTLGFTVQKDGAPVTDLQPYLAAYGHLVALREGDLAYLHVHPGGDTPVGATPGGPRIEFTATTPTPGTYRLFLEFQHDGAVHTVEFTVALGAPSADEAHSSTNPTTEQPHGSGHAH